jgi:alpha-beta hydrolase superfamily lysophospholipase
MAQYSEDYIDGKGGVRIFVRSWRPEGTPRGVLAICPGFNAHSGHYKWVGEQCAASLGMRRG